MRAAVLRNTGDDKLEIRDDIELGAVGPGEVKVKIMATGVCHSDVSGMNGTIPQPAPFIPGHEGAGVVAEVGEGVTSVQPGDHVIIAWSAPCGTCKFCVDRKQPNLCMQHPIDRGDGHAALPPGRPPPRRLRGLGHLGRGDDHARSRASVKIDPDTPHEIASLVGCGVMTGVGAALNTAKVTPGSSVVVFGCGGVGISAIQGARVAGRLRDRGRRPGRLQAGGRPAVRRHPRGQARRARRRPSERSPAATASTSPSRPSACRDTMRAAYDATRRGGTTCIIGVGGLDKMVSFSAFELFFAREEAHGLLLRLGRRPQRLQPHAQPVEATAGSTSRA